MAIFNLSLCILHMLFVIAGIPKTDKKLIVHVDEEYCSPKLASAGVYLAEHFDDEEAFRQRWVQHYYNKQIADENTHKSHWEIQPPVRKLLNNDLGLVLLSEGERTTVSVLLDKTFEFNEKPLIVQYEVTWQEEQKCGGAYIQLLSDTGKMKADFDKFFNQYLYTILFGPDKCGNSNDLHFIFRYENPEDSNTEKSFYKKLSHGLESYYNDRRPHLYTLVIRSDNTYTILIDYNVIIHESFPEDFTSHAYKSGKENYRLSQVAPIYSVGFALWTLTSMILIDNVLVTDEPTVARQWAAQTFALKRAKICSNVSADVTTDQYCLKSDVELEAEGCTIKRQIENESDKAVFEDSAIDLHTTYTESQLDCGLEYAGIVLCSCLFVGLSTYVWCRPKSSLDAKLKNVDARAKCDLHQLEIDTKAKSDPNLLIVDAKAKSDIHHLGIDARAKTDANLSELAADRDKDEVEPINQNEVPIKEDMSKAKLKNSETEQINSDNESSLGGRQKSSNGDNLWLYTGVIVGSFISIGLATYMWSGSKSNAEAKRKKTGSDNRRSKVEKSRKEKKSTVIESNIASEDKAGLESTTDCDGSYEEIEESDGIVEEDLRNPPKFEDEIRRHRENGPRVIKRPSIGGTSRF